MKQICLDTGIFSIFFEDKSRDRHKVLELFQKFRKKGIEGHVLNPVISEVYYQLCVLKGKDYATSKLVSLLNIYPIKLIAPGLNDLILAGQIKCSDRKKLSYIDCLSIAYSLNTNISFHTTEKLVKKIPIKTLERLKITTYFWD
ncbi:MAG: PIN domain-containing protein [Promethearchaeota archaeon]